MCCSESKLGGAGRLSNSFDICDSFESVVLPKLALAFAILFLVARPFLLPVLVVPVTSSVVVVPVYVPL